MRPHFRMRGLLAGIAAAAVAAATMGMAQPASGDRQIAGLLGEFSIQLMMERAAAGDPAAQFRLGGQYARGHGVPQNDEAAVKWWREAASQGLAEAQNELGTAYADGHGVARDPRQAVHWFTLAADQGLAIAQANLGTMYALGTGVARNDRRAAELYRAAADQGMGWAQFFLGQAHEQGRGVRASLDLAVHWYLKAAQQDYGAALFRLGVLYRRSPQTLPSVDSRVLEAYGEHWIARAARQGIHEAITHLDGMVESTCRRRQRLAAGTLHAVPQGGAPVIAAVSGEPACVLPAPGRTSRRLEGWAAVYLPEAMLVGFIRTQDLDRP